MVYREAFWDGRNACGVALALSGLLLKKERNRLCEKRQAVFGLNGAKRAFFAGVLTWKSVRRAANDAITRKMLDTARMGQIGRIFSRLREGTCSLNGLKWQFLHEKCRKVHAEKRCFWPETGKNGRFCVWA